MVTLILALAEIMNQLPEPETKIPTAISSWYGPGFHSRLMANGEVFNMNDPTVVAHKNLPFGTEVHLRNPENGRQLTVTVKDRGPFIDGREFDLSAAGADKLGFKEKGVTPLEILSIQKP